MSVLFLNIEKHAQGRRFVIETVEQQVVSEI